MSDAPETIWAAECRQTHSTMWWPDDAGGVGTEYRRADLPPTPEQIAADPRVQALVEAATNMKNHLDKWQETGEIATPDESKALYDGLSDSLDALHASNPAEFTTTTTTKETQ